MYELLLEVGCEELPARHVEPMLEAFKTGLISRQGKSCLFGEMFFVGTSCIFRDGDCSVKRIRMKERSSSSNIGTPMISSASISSLSHL